MLKIATRIVLALALCASPALITPALAQQTDTERRAYQAGYPGKNLREVAREKGYPLEETGFFNRTAGVVPKIGPAREWM